jgi:hypothetical protein
MRAALLFLLALPWLADALPAAAQSLVCPGRISARIGGEMPDKAAMLLAVKVPGDREIEVAFRRALFAALRRNDYIMGVPPTHFLIWQGNISRPPIGAPPPKAERPLVREEQLGRETGEIVALPGMPTLDRDAMSFRPDTLRIEGLVQLRELLTGRVIWNAELTCARATLVDEGTEAALVSTLVNAIVPAIGKTLRNKEF